MASSNSNNRIGSFTSPTGPPPSPAAAVNNIITALPDVSNTSYLTSSLGNGSVTYTSNVADADFDQQARIIILWLEIVLGTVGGMLVCMWLWYNRRRRSRVNMLILQVALTDLAVIWVACVPQLIWEYSERHWSLGNVMCKLLKFSQSVVLIASNYIVVVLSIDRHQAIRAPLKEPIPVWKMSLTSWVWSILLSLPMLYLFSAVLNTSPTSRFFNMVLCEPIFRQRPKIERQVFLTFISLVHFCVPFVIIVFCYVRIFLKIAEKAAEGKGTKKATIKPGKVHLQSTPSSSLPKAKVKTLKMTLVIVVSFIVCVLPYHIAEMILNFGDPRVLSKVLYAVIGGMAVANSATNPYVFLLFNANVKCARGFVASVFPCGAKSRERRAYFESTASTRSEYMGGGGHGGHRTEYTLNTDVCTSTAGGGAGGRMVSKYSPSSNAIETVEMTIKGKSTASGAQVKKNYTLLTASGTEVDAAPAPKL